MKILLVCNPGGHLTDMLSLEKFWSNHEREWVTYRHFHTEKLSRKEKVYWVKMQEARMLIRAIINFFNALLILRKSKPDLVVSTGASLAVPFILASKLYKIKTIFIETIGRPDDLSLSAKLVYNIVDELYVQWPECLERYPKALYRGIIT